MVGQIPGIDERFLRLAHKSLATLTLDSSDPSGLSRIDFGPPLESTAHRAQGYDLGLVAVLEKPEDVKVYAEHPSHQK
jgi:hypothetical protein